MGSNEGVSDLLVAVGRDLGLAGAGRMALRWSGATVHR